ncbi:flagellar biosynthesis protein FlhF [Marinobacterium lutimaris]|uniref:Flagellar biosynthesis protein FlhF n=1 Tax=Marinobacterium lutimaris TaxID=568106 RepID=A0A1H6BBM3_9GAMM|nr:flagellar biosynthesis protein FlhF [Marinobacterium lutimaris]SEG58148.1 flagellar biosynthesis protein FlhF [Marinobacterium lutimaris]
MKVKRIFAPDMRQAMRRVREEIGPDAVIVSNHRVAGGVEIVVAREEEYEAAQSELKQERARRREEQVRILTGSAAGQGGDKRRELEQALERTRLDIAKAQEGQGPSEVSRTANRQLDGDDEELHSILESLRERQRSRDAHQAQAHKASPGAAPLQASRHEPELGSVGVSADERDNAQIRNMQNEIQQLRSMLEQQLSAKQSAPQPSPRSQAFGDAEMARAGERSSGVKGQLEHRFERLGLGGRLTSSLLASIEPGLPIDKAWRNSLARLADSIPVVGEELIERGGMLAFLGPTGVGKTTTIGKLAARYVLQHGSSSLALVTTDCFRIAAHEQLKTFGRILDVPVRVVDENHSLDEVLQSLKGKRLVLIDTAGMNARDPSGQLQLEMLESVSVRVKKLLVLSCSSQRQLLESAWQTYSALGLHGCVLSKMDESGSLGEALTLAVEKQLPVAYVADGQKIPDDIGLARRHDLVSRAVVTAQRDTERARSGSGDLYRAG